MILQVLRPVVAAVLFALLPLVGHAQNDDGSATALKTQTNPGSTKVGKLTCKQTGRTHQVFYTTSRFTCIFDPDGVGAKEIYRARIAKIGIDLTKDKVETIIWWVLAPTSGIRSGALEGSYVGAAVDAAIGTGGGARVLVGGLDRSFALQPASLSTQDGTGIAVGVEKLTLTLVN
jgi:hypothetical protein